MQNKVPDRLNMWYIFEKGIVQRISSESRTAVQCLVFTLPPFFGVSRIDRSSLQHFQAASNLDSLHQPKKISSSDSLQPPATTYLQVVAKYIFQHENELNLQSLYTHTPDTTNTSTTHSSLSENQTRCGSVGLKH